MRLKLLLLVFCGFMFICEKSYSQTHELNHAKYWYYKHRLHHQYLTLDEGQGGGLIANQFGLSGRMHYGDQTINLGIYLAVLALEYNLLATNDQDTYETRKEIFFLLWAINRLDLNAESLFRPSYNGEPNPNSSDLNGFFVRDDVDIQFVLENYNKFNNGIVTTQVQLVDPSLWSDFSDWSSDEQLGYTDLENFGGNSEMSHDQVYWLLFGLAMVNYYVPNNVHYINDVGQVEIFQDGLSELADESVAILERIIGHCSGKSFNASSWYPWRILNPETNNPVKRGDNAGIWSYLLARDACHGILANFSNGLLNWHCSTHNAYSIFNSAWVSIQQNTGAVYYTSNDNSHMWSLLNAMDGLSNYKPSHMAGYIFRDMQHVPLIRQIFYGGVNPGRIHIILIF